MPNYSYALVSDAVAALSSRLYDPNGRFWTGTEQVAYITEALRTWNALSQFWRSEMVFSPQLNTSWYDLRTVAGSIIPYTVTKYSLISQIEYHLLEPATPAAWTGSNQFALQDIVNALQRRQDETLGVTACTLGESLVGAAVGIRTILPDNVIDLRRVAWIPATGFGYVNKILKQSDMWAEQAFNPTYTTAAQGPPSNWMQNTEPPPSFDVDQVPPVPGQYDVLTTNAGPAWAAGTDGTLTIPDDWTWVIKWGALLDLLSRESNSKDELRAAYCKQRYEEGLKLLGMMPTVLALRMNNIPLAVDAVRNGDDFNPGWQAAAAGPPTSAYLAANLLALAPMPDSSTNYSATVSVCQNAPIGAQFIQVARDDFDSIIDYAQHLAMLKVGGAEFAATIPLYQKFQAKAAQYNSKLLSMGFFEMPQLELGQREEHRNPRYVAGA